VPHQRGSVEKLQHLINIYMFTVFLGLCLSNFHSVLLLSLKKYDNIKFSRLFQWTSERSEARTAFGRSNTGIMVSNPTRGMDVCPRFSVMLSSV
jgi:hypothetical protein